MKEQELAVIVQRIEQAERWRDSSFGELWQDCYRRFRSRSAVQREGSNIFVPQTFMQCQVIRSRLEDTVFASRPYVSALPRGRGDSEQADKMQLLLDWQLNDRMGLMRIIGEQAITGLLIYGTAVVYTGWECRTRQVRRGRWQHTPLLDSDGKAFDDELGRPMMLPRETVELQTETEYDDPICVSLDLFDFFCDSRAASIGEARFCGHKEFVSRARLKQMEQAGKYCIDWDELRPSAETTAAAARAGLSTEGESEGSEGLYLLHHYWEDNRHLVILNRSQCVQEEENPFWHGMKPYDKCCYVAMPGEFYGIGVPEILAGLQDELNTARNQRIDYNSLALRRMWKLRRGCGLTARDLLWRQNGVLQVENMDDVQEINIQNLPADAFANESSIKQDMQDVTGCHDIIMGMSYAAETATTTTTRDNNAAQRFKMAVRALIEDLLVPVARKCVSMDQQFLAGSRLVRLLTSAGDTVQIDPSELGGEYDVIYCGTAVESLANREQNKQRALQAYSLALADPAYQRDDAARLKLFERVLNSLELDEPGLLPQATADVGSPFAGQMM